MSVASKPMDAIIVPLEVKALRASGDFSGYAAVFGSVDSQNDAIMPGAFARSLAEHKAAGTWPALLWMHDASKHVGGWRSIREDQKGLRVEGTLSLGTGHADQAYALMKDEAVTGLSVGYRTRGSHHDPKNGTRVLTDLDLREISLVAMPANSGARVDRVKEDKVEVSPDCGLLSPAALCREIEARSQALACLSKEQNMNKRLIAQ